MRLTEIFLSVPELLIIILLQAVIGKATIWSLAFVIGITSWTGIAKIVRTEVIQLKNSEYVLAARSMGGSFFYILIRHLTPNFISSIMFMVVMNVRGAIVAESTLSLVDHTDTGCISRGDADVRDKSRQLSENKK